MSLVTALQKIGNLLRALIRILRKAFCCRKRQNESETLLPVRNLSNSEATSFKNEFSDFSSWDNWDDSSSNSPSNTVAVNIDQQQAPENDEVTNKIDTDDEIHEDFFKDMVPQFRKAKKLIVNEPQQDSAPSVFAASTSRLCMDPKAFLTSEAELGLLMDNSSNWEVCSNMDEVLDPESAIKEKRLAEREKRIAEHQRRKLEKENKRMVKPTMSNVQSYQSSNDKTKNS